LSITLSREGNSKIEIKQSVFIGRAMRIHTPEEAAGFIAEERAKYPDARHSCYAWKLTSGTNMQKYSDDGEPSGTAGMPLLSLITKPDLTDCAVVVTRYFGGILLGKGGLVRAYTDAGAQAIKDANPVRLEEGTAFEISCAYPDYDRILFELTKRGYSVENTDFGESVKITAVTKTKEEAVFVKLLADLSSGKIVPEKVGAREIVAEELTDF